MDIEISIIILCVIATVISFNIWVLIKLNSVSLTALGPIFERSSGLIIFGLIANLSESVLNILCGYLSFINHHKIDEVQVIILCLIVFTSRLYAACMFFRILRIFVLSKFRKGEISREFFKKVNTYKLVYIACILYAGILLTVIISVVYSYHMHYVLIPELCSTCYVFESFLFLVMSIVSLTTMAHPTLSVEYFIYSSLWVTGLFSYTKNLEIRWLFYVPIRNNILVLISLIALNRHKDVVRPPLPSEISYQEILQIEELYFNFESFVKQTNDEKLIFACNALKEFAKGSFFEDYTVIEVDTTELKTLFDISLEEIIEEKLYENLKEYMMDILNPVLIEYKESFYFHQFKRKFFIQYN